MVQSHLSASSLVAGRLQRPSPLCISEGDNYVEEHSFLQEHSIPVRRTFIEYGSLTPTLKNLSGMHTAPASMSHSVRESLDVAGKITDDNTCMSPSVTLMSIPQKCGVSSTDKCTTPPFATMTYSMSPRSAKAAGCWSMHGFNFGLPPVGGEAALKGRTLSKESTVDDGNSSQDEEEEEYDVVFCPVYSEAATLPSMGSASHGHGTCRRCCFFPKGRCNNGYDCQFCHFDHEKRKQKHNKTKQGRKKRAAKQRQMKVQSDASTFVGTSLVPATCYGMKGSAKHSSSFNPATQAKNTPLDSKIIEPKPAISQTNVGALETPFIFSTPVFIPSGTVPVQVVGGNTLPVQTMTMMQMWQKPCYKY